MRDAVTNWVKGSSLRLQRPFARSEPGEQETLQGREPGTQELTEKQADQLRTRDKECGTVQQARKFTYLTLAQVQGGTESRANPGAKSPAAPCPRGILSPIRSSHPQMCSSC